MEVTQELINYFFQNKCSQAEADAVVSYFRQNKEALEYYMGKDEWDAISAEGDFDEAISKKMLMTLKQELFKKESGKIIKFRKIYFTRTVAAASVLIIAVGAWWYIEQFNSKKIRDAAMSGNTQMPNVSTKSINSWQVKTNTRDNSMKIGLQDGSVVTLFKGAIIKYHEPFIGNSREVKLDGDAFFEVAKNKLKPFIVYSGNLSTTALGTSFRVTAFNEGKATIKVKLYTGKVVIKSIKKEVYWKNNIFLTPGEQLTYNANNAEVLVSKIIENKEAVTIIREDTKNVALSNELKFNNTSLGEVLKEIGVFYNIKISYSDAEIKKMNFTGVINRTDKVESIMKVITQMNDLELLKIADGFIVRGPLRK